MFGSLIKFVAETTGQIIGEVAHQVSEIGTAITEIPDAFSKGYDKELFHSQPQPSEPSDNIQSPTSETQS